MILRTFLAMLICSISATVFSQTDLILNIHHKLNAYDFELGATGMTQDSAIFKLDRLQYYISEIEIEHDGGQVTPVEDTWLLVNAAGQTSVNLETQGIVSVEKVRFSVGVDSAHNYLDPSQYSLGHPLALSMPSMHWGWAAGYRFVAVEGEDEAETGFEIHALGGDNYFQTEVEVASTMVGDDNVIDIYANYSRGFDNIDVTSGFINHGEVGEAVTLLENFSNEVFSATEPTDSFRVESPFPTGIIEMENEISVLVMPNPATNGVLNFSIQSNLENQFSAVVFDITGKEVAVMDNLRMKDALQVSGLESGIYFLRINNENSGVSLTKKVVLK